MLLHLNGSRVFVSKRTKCAENVLHDKNENVNYVVIINAVKKCVCSPLGIEL